LTISWQIAQSGIGETRTLLGDHEIAEHIHRHFEHSRLNRVELMPHLTTLRIYDNSADADPASGKPPSPSDLKHIPGWGQADRSHGAKIAPALTLTRLGTPPPSRACDFNPPVCTHLIVALQKYFRIYE
jgi:hypothetical protein